MTNDTFSEEFNLLALGIQCAYDDYVIGHCHLSVLLKPYGWESPQE
jgi:hypothetical protein